jgi:putative tricarboxylic transport membrane protein
VRVLKVPYRILFPLILFFCVIGCYSLYTRAFDVFMMLIFGIIGYIFRKVKYEPAPLVLAFILGSLMENALGQSLLMFGGDLSLFITRPISASCLIVALMLLLGSIFSRKGRGVLAKIS